MQISTIRVLYYYQDKMKQLADTFLSG